MSIGIERLTCRYGALILIFVGTLAPGDAASQEVIVPLQFSFSDPGARSMGFGGAFVALADDATASLANPAGLVQLTRPEVSVEGRNWKYSTPFAESGRVEGLPSGFGIDRSVGLTTSTSDDSLTGLSYVSFVYPHGKWSFAWFRHQLTDFEFHSETQGLFGGGTNCCQVRLYDQRAMSEMRIVSYGIFGARRITEKLSLGFGMVYHDAVFDAKSTSFLPDDSPAGILGPTSYHPEKSVLEERNFFDDKDWTLAGGFLWRLTDNWTIGGVYRRGAKFEIGAETTAGQAGDFGVLTGTVLDRLSGLPLQLPGTVGLGFAYRAPNDRLTVSFQWDRIDYSSIVESIPIDGQTIDDVNELHLGGEYVFLGATPIIALRIGAWLDPDHQLRDTTDDPFLRTLLPKGDDQVHYTAGVGLAFQSFQIDLGVDFSDLVDTVSLSAIYSF